MKSLRVEQLLCPGLFHECSQSWLDPSENLDVWDRAHHTVNHEPIHPAGSQATLVSSGRDPSVQIPALRRDQRVRMRPAVRTPSRSGFAMMSGRRGCSGNRAFRVMVDERERTARLDASRRFSHEPRRLRPLGRSRPRNCRSRCTVDRDALAAMKESGPVPGQATAAAGAAAPRPAVSRFRLYFGGQVVSASGSFLQQTAIGWLVLELTGSPGDLGLVLARESRRARSGLIAPLSLP